MKKLLLAVIALVLLSGCATVEDVRVSVEEPASVTLGETFEVSVTIENLGTGDRLLTSVDIGDKYLEGMTLYGSEPSWTEAWDFGWVGFQSYDYQMNIPSGESLNLVYSFEAMLTGNYEGALDVCLDTEYECVYNTMFTVVEEEL
jgi:uncharacterized protein YceK